MSRCNWHILRRRADFISLQNKGKRWITPAFIVQMDCSSSLSDQINTDDSPFMPPHIGLTATRKLGSAVVRNRAKRRLRAVLDDVLADPTRFSSDYQGCDLVLIARSDILTAEFNDLTRDLRWALRKLGLFTSDKSA